MFAKCTVSGNDDTPDHSRRRRCGLRGRIVPAVATTARRTAGEHANTSRAIHFSSKERTRLKIVAGATGLWHRDNYMYLHT